MGSIWDDSRLHAARSYTSSPDSPFSLRSSFTQSAHLFFGLPLLLLPYTSIPVTLFPKCSSLLTTCPFSVFIVDKRMTLGRAFVARLVDGLKILSTDRFPIVHWRGGEHWQSCWLDRFERHIIGACMASEFRLPQSVSPTLSRVVYTPSARCYRGWVAHTADDSNYIAPCSDTSADDLDRLTCHMHATATTGNINGLFTSAYIACYGIQSTCYCALDDRLYRIE